MDKAEKIAYLMVSISAMVLFTTVFNQRSLWDYVFPESEQLFVLSGLLSLCALYINPFVGRSEVDWVGQPGFRRVLSSSLPSISAVFAFGSGVAQCFAVLSSVAHADNWLTILPVFTPCVICILGPLAFPIVEPLIERRIRITKSSRLAAEDNTIPKTDDVGAYLPDTQAVRSEKQSEGPQI